MMNLTVLPKPLAFNNIRRTICPRNKILGRATKTEIPSMKKEFWALDFDGVICDSCGESSLSAWKAASILWPDMLSSQSALEMKDIVIEKMRDIRPVVETGYENVVQIRCLLESMSVDEILSDWPKILTSCMEKWNLNRANLVELFGSTRDAWMKEDLQSWLAPNRIYNGLPEALPKAMDRAEVYIVTTKQARFTHSLLRDMANVEFPLERIISTTVSGQPKTEILYQLQQAYPDQKHLFIEDKLSTLDKVCLEDSLKGWKLYFADWGYNTQSELTRASHNSRIHIINLTEFSQLLINGN